MIVPMKKVLLLIQDKDRQQAMKKLRKLGLLHVEISQGSGARLAELKAQVAEIEQSMFAITESADKNTVPESIDEKEALRVARSIADLLEEKKQAQAEISANQSELQRLESWGEMDPEELAFLTEKGITLVPYEMPLKEYKNIGDTIRTIPVTQKKNVVYFLVVEQKAEEISEESAEAETIPASYRVELPQLSTTAMETKIAELQGRVKAIDEELKEDTRFIESMKQAIAGLEKEIEMETYVTGMAQEAIEEASGKSLTLAYLTGYIPTEDMDQLRACAKENAWGLLEDDPTQEDDVPTKLKNNKIVSLIYPLTDFLGTVPGYFEYDISGWFLGFILIFFGIIFGDGGYGLLISGVALALILKAKNAKKAVPPVYLLILLFGLATILWGTLTCTWFGLKPDQLPGFLKSISLPVISNVNEAKIWYPFWTNGEVGLTTAQNVQIFCFSLALVQLSVAHIKAFGRNRRSLKCLGDLGSILELVGMFYVVLTLVVNGEVFGLGRVINGIPVGTIAIALVGIGFVMNFVFANFEGNIVKSILESLKNIVSVLLGVVNVFSDIVSYIRLWAVGLAGAAISATVNEMAGPLFGRAAFVIFAIILLVFGHGLNMILNVLSVIVHGVRLNTLEFSTHLDMSWSGHKYKPFSESDAE